MRVLIVEKTKTMRGILREVVEQIEDAHVDEAVDGAEGLRIVEEAVGPYDVYILDWSMSNMGGLTFARKIRKIDPDTPIIMATTKSERNKVEDAIQSGVINYLVKPFTSQDVLDIVEKVTQSV